jgi:hypothetical protein
MFLKPFEVSSGPNEWQATTAFKENRYLHAVCSTGLLAAEAAFLLLTFSFLFVLLSGFFLRNN